MPELPGAAPAAPSLDRLDSWKAIAAYLDRDVSTVQRWEKRNGLPIHRHSRGGSVYAFRSELESWWKRDGQRLPEAERPAAASRSRWALGALIGASVIAGGAAYTRWHGAHPAVRSLAVLPLANYSDAP